MKTNYFNIRQISLYTFLGILGMAVTSCSSYQNTSSYIMTVFMDLYRTTTMQPIYTYNDGNVQHYNKGDNTGQNMNYKAYFSRP